jgi:hypothetical protein
VVLHRKNPAAQEKPVLEGLLRCQKLMAERDGFAPILPHRSLPSHIPETQGGGRSGFHQDQFVDSEDPNSSHIKAFAVLSARARQRASGWRRAKPNCSRLRTIQVDVKTNRPLLAEYWPPGLVDQRLPATLIAAQERIIISEIEILRESYRYSCRGGAAAVTSPVRTVASADLVALADSGFVSVATALLTKLSCAGLAVSSTNSGLPS